ncbi:Cystathionine gamma-synthase [Labilithrix luteola]|uniref:Cystathionine gamma-synthase n=1 Tax=Labilithrix luteola TaxID=1391654 RepID=A0A0K1QFN2_9BACT|nr:PLP-dependent transferase [Labilithrix luteola]AKV04467.1 Cystathionine gamma-synthase [Labilithrix luteola]
MAPEVAYLLARSLRRLVVRVRAHNESAGLLARRLAEHPRVERVNYPGLTSHAQHALAKRQMSGFGGSFVVRGDAKSAAAVVDRLELFRLRRAWGASRASSPSPSPRPITG